MNQYAVAPPSPAEFPVSPVMPSIISHVKFNLVHLNHNIRMVCPTLCQMLNADWIVASAGELRPSRRFQCLFTGSKTRKKNYKSSCFKMCINDVYISCSASAHPILSSFHTPHDANTCHTKKNESTLILMRHGQSMWNEKNLFTGCVDVPLTNKGVEEAIEAGKRISTLPLDVIYISALIRSQMTAMLALTQHCCMKVPIVMHCDTEQARTWTQIYSEGTKNQSIPVVKAWQLNERMYGDLQGFNKQETAERYGSEQVHKWRRSYHVRPPNGESLEMCLGRAVSFFKEQIEPQLLCGRHVMVVAHANSLRSIIMYLDKLTSEEVINLELSTGVPMLYMYNEGNFIRRGSLIGSNEAGVYAYSESLAIYKQNLGETTPMKVEG